MEKNTKVKSAELSLGESVREEDFFKIPKTLVVEELVESYRQYLVDEYKKKLFNNWDKQVHLDLIEELMTEAVMVLNASEEEILKMFFEDAQEKYFNQLFDASTKNP